METLLHDIRYGATSLRIARLVVGEGLVCALAGSAAGLLGAVAAGRALSAWLFGITASDPVTLLLVAALLGTVTLSVSLIAALRGTRVDPIIALRHD